MRISNLLKSEPAHCTRRLSRADYLVLARQKPCVGCGVKWENSLLVPGRRARSWQRHAVAEVVLPQLTKIQQVDGEGYLNK
jgi:hypothetical protein